MLTRPLRLALRALRRRPGFAVTAILALALGIGANTAIFSAVDTVILRAYDFPDPGQVVQVWDGRPTTQPGVESQISIPNWEDYRAAQTVFEYFAGFQSGGPVYRQGEDGTQETVSTLNASFELFSILGVRATLGRLFLPEEEDPGAPPTALLSHAFWQKLGGDPSIIGQTLEVLGWRMNEGWAPWQLEIVGVLPGDFSMPPIQVGQNFRVYGDADIVLPMGLWTWGRGNRGMFALRVLARLGPGISVEQARAQMASISAGLAEAYPEGNDGLHAVVTPLPELVRGEHARRMALLWGGAILVLLIACANVAALTLVRALGQRRELAIRRTLGAGRMRIFGQLLTENLVLGVAGGALGLVLALAGVGLIGDLAPPEVTGLEGISLNARVLMFTLGVAVITGAVVGLVPAFRAASPDLTRSLKVGSRGSGRRTAGLRVLVAGQVGLAFMLVAASFLLFGSLSQMLRVDPGFEVDRQVFIRVETLPPPLSRFREDQQFIDLFRQIQENLESRLDVVSVTGGQDLPLSGSGNAADFTIANRPAPEGDRPYSAWFWVPPQYFQSMGIRLLEGREFNRDTYQVARQALETQGTPLPETEAIVSEPFARRYWPGESALGKVFYYGIQDPYNAPDLSYETGWDNRYPQPFPLRIVGVVEPVNQLGLAPEDPLQFYTIMGRFSWLAVQMRGDVMAGLSGLREAVEAIDPELSVTAVEPAKTRIRRLASATRFQLVLIGLFGSLAVIMAGLGLYGVLAYSLRQRMHELGVRMTLGASASDMRRMVARQAVVILAFGLAVGLAGAMAADRLLRSFLFNLAPTDFRFLLAAAATIGLVGALAAVLPTRRASRVEVVEVLRYE